MLSAAALFVLCLASPGRATVQIQTPWHPVAAAYLTGLFGLNLTPTDWDFIERAYAGGAQAPTGRSVYQLLAPVTRLAGVDHASAIRAAIAKKDAGALHGASTRMLSQVIRDLLRQAADRLNQPGAAAAKLREARNVYRAFADFIRQADAIGFRRLGLAWLEMTSSAGSAGLGGSGAKPPDAETFAAARKLIEGYLIANYEAAALPTARPFAPVPTASPSTNLKVKLAPWLPPGTDLRDQDPLPRLVLNIEAQGIDEKDVFLVAYGDMLFDSPQIFGEPARTLGISCAVCHNRGDVNRRFFIPGISPQPGAVDVDGSFFNARFNDHRSDALDIPSMRGIRFTGPYGRDGRFASLREFIRNVIVNEFAGAEPTPLMLDALVIYMFEFDFLPAPYLDPDGSLNDKAPAAARRGERIFKTPFAGMNGKSCASCHVPSANFLDRRAHDIGSGKGASGSRAGAFDTPTLLGLNYTAPYFHDGSLATLRDVVEWFDGKFSLRLSAGQKTDLAAYLEAVGTVLEPFERFDDENTPFRLAFDELSTFASTLNTLIPARDRFHADLLIQTVAPDMRLDASGMADRSLMPQVYELADLLDDIGAAIRADEWNRAASLWARYRELEADYGPKFK